MNALLLPLAQVAGGGFGGVGLAQVLIYIIVIAAAIGILFLALKYFGVQIPPIAVQIFWICLVAFLAIVAIRFLLSL